MLTSVIVEHAKGNPDKDIKSNWQAARAVLRAQHPDRWAEKRKVEVTGPGGGALLVSHAIVVQQFDRDPEARDLITRLAERQAHLIITGAIRHGLIEADDADATDEDVIELDPEHDYEVSADEEDEDRWYAFDEDEGE